MFEQQPHLSRESIVPFLGKLFEEHGACEYLGEQVTIGQHMLQAATLAENSGCADDIVVSALLHDIGHFTGDLGIYTPEDTEDRFHERAGATFLKPFFPAIVCDCVRYHVAAKRYLCATDPAYFNRLSQASVHTLQLQGGPMTVQEVMAFDAQPHRDKIIAVRHFDEAGKAPEMPTPDFWYFAPRIQAIVQNQRS